MTDFASQGPIEDDPRIGRASARLILSAMASSEAPEVAASGISRADLWAHVRRVPGDPVNFAAERAIRTDPEAARMYRRLLGFQSVARSEMAAAAYDSSATHRRIGSFELDVIEEDDAPPALVIQCLSDTVPAPTLIEVVSIEGVVRLALPAPVDRHIVIDLPRQDAERDLLRLMLANPLSGVYLL